MTTSWEEYSFGATLWRAVARTVELGCGIVRFFHLLLAQADIFRIVRTGQAHRTLLGHTGPVTCLQFDETHLISGSLDKSIRVGLDPS
jgi:hypothetical protein